MMRAHAGPQDLDDHLAAIGQRAACTWAIEAAASGSVSNPEHLASGLPSAAS